MVSLLASSEGLQSRMVSRGCGRDEVKKDHFTNISTCTNVHSLTSSALIRFFVAKRCYLQKSSLNKNPEEGF